jgi:hypothetical protein
MRLLTNLWEFICGNDEEKKESEEITMLSVGAPSITEHDGSLSKITLVYKDTINHLQQNHVIDNQLNIRVAIKGWPKREKYENPASMTLWVRNKDHIPKAVTFLDPLEWWDETGPIDFTPSYAGTQPLYRFWSWGDGRVFASLVSQAMKDE